MMESSKTDPVPEHRLTQFLLGNLRGEDCERLDELSIADDEFAERLCAAENDLVDAYVRGRLRGDALRDFESHYLATDVRREKVAIARTLYLADAKPVPDTESELSQARPSASATVNPRSPMWIPRLDRGWLAVAAVLILCVTTAWLAVENHRLRQRDQASLVANTVLEQELQQLRREVQEAQAVQNSPAAEAEVNAPQIVNHRERLISSIFLLPPTRGSATIPVASMAAKDHWLRLQLALESDDFSEYTVDLMDLGSSKYVWRSGSVKSSNVNHRRALSLLLPIGGLGPQRYAAEVNGVAADGRREALGSYVFRIDLAAPPQDKRR